jgi:hypothetical protein
MYSYYIAYTSPKFEKNISRTQTCCITTTLTLLFVVLTSQRNSFKLDLRPNFKTLPLLRLCIAARWTEVSVNAYWEQLVRTSNNFVSSLQYFTTLPAKRYNDGQDSTARWGQDNSFCLFFYTLSLIGLVLTSNEMSGYMSFRNVFVYNISSWFGQGSLSSRTPKVQNLPTNLKKYYTLVCLRSQNACHLTASVLELLINRPLLALTGYNYLRIWILVHSVYPKVKCENIVIDKNGDIFLVIVFEVGG